MNALILFAGLQPESGSIGDQLAAIMAALIAVGLVAFYASERGWFGRLAHLGMALVAIGLVPMVVGSAAIGWVPSSGESFFIAYLLGLLVALLGAIVLGIAMLRSDAAPRAAAWLLIVALPVGLPATIGYTLVTMGVVDHAWVGPELLFGLAWVVIGYSLWNRRATLGVEEASR
ncbi:hypothetical protein [Halalkalicoccus ordinarius]|uniref:hypothetical protein n=1 Tax=Halalkalicoccus ordinarius TaxID=3116651 RepID=UPI00300EE094